MRLKHLASFYLQTVFTNSVSELGTESNGWDRFNYANNFDVGLHTVHDNVDRIDSRFVSVEEFQQKYEKTYTPVVIVNDQLDWPATKKWFTNVSICYDVIYFKIDCILYTLKSIEDQLYITYTL